MSINSVSNYYNTQIQKQEEKLPELSAEKITQNSNSTVNKPSQLSSQNVIAYHTSFSGLGDKLKAKSRYNAVNKYLDKNSRALFKQLSELGILDNDKSNDGSSVMDNLYKIATTERLQGISKENILRETVKLLANPYSITQKFGDLPQKLIPKLEQEAQEKISPEFYQVTSSTCFATSIEFNLAQKQPAEFTRMVEGLTSPAYSVQKKLQMSDISPNFTEALHDLVQFNTDFKIEPDWKTLNVTLKPDRNAIVRARVQNSYKDENERSCVDVLMQSMIMNMGSQQTYDAITDIRTGSLNPDSTGLTNFEGNFANKLVEGKSKVSIIYQNLDENGRLAGHYFDNATIKSHIMEALESGNNLIIGYTILNDNNKVIGGHEITLTGATVVNGEDYFVCNDSDDDNPEPVYVKMDELIPLIHHADIPGEIITDYEEQTKNQWKYELQELKAGWPSAV